jgi:CheY-like chemotaxis protein
MKIVLVVDDDPAYQRTCARILREVGYDVLVAGSGREAMSVLTGARLDLLLTDIFMPEKNGLEVIQIVRRQFPHVQVICMSGGGPSGRAAEALEHARVLGARAILAKPFKATELVRLAEEAIGPAS